jgi:tellurite resistance protein
MIWLVLKADGEISPEMKNIIDEVGTILGCENIPWYT